MKQPIDAEPVTPSGLNENGLSQILENVVEEVRISISRDISGADLLYSLLNAPWLQSLLKVYECLQQYLQGSPSPFLPYASGLSQEVMVDLRMAASSPDARELLRLLRDPNMQAVLSAHDTVAQKDFEPVLPPLPDNIPEEEEAMRIVCLVKNKQPLKSCRGIRKRWDSLKQRTKEKLLFAGRKPEGSASSGLVSAKPHFQQPGNCKFYKHSAALWEEGINRSAPSVCSSVLIDDVIEEIDSETEESPTVRQREPLQSFSLTSADFPTCSSVRPGQRAAPDDTPGFPRRAHTAPPSPLQYSHRNTRFLEVHQPPGLSHQKSLEELRSTVQLVANTVDKTSSDVKLLGEKVVAATEMMSETMQENTQALNLLMEVVEKLQDLILASKPPDSAQTRLPNSSSSSSSCSSSGSFSQFVDSLVGYSKPLVPNHSLPKAGAKLKQRSPLTSNSPPQLPNGVWSSRAEENNRTGCLSVKKKKKKK